MVNLPGLSGALTGSSDSGILLRAHRWIFPRGKKVVIHFWGVFDRPFCFLAFLFLLAQPTHLPCPVLSLSFNTMVGTKTPPGSPVLGNSPGSPILPAMSPVLPPQRDELPSNMKDALSDLNEEDVWSGTPAFFRALAPFRQGLFFSFMTCSSKQKAHPRFPRSS